MAQVFRAQTTGTTQGLFKGGSPRKGWENYTECNGFDYTVDSPFDANRGAYTGKRRHGPVTLRAQVDKSGPQYLTAVVTNEVLKTVKIDFFMNNPAGKETNFYSVVLTNAAVVSARTYTDEYPTHQDATGLREIIETKFSFHMIAVPWKDGWLAA